MSRELPLMREFLSVYRHPRVRLFRRNIIDKTVQDIHSGKMHQVKAGIVGQSDVYGYLKSSQKGFSVPFEIEFKGAKTPTSEEQISWRSFCLSWGIPHITLRAKVDETSEQTIQRWTSELHNLVDKCIGQ